MIKLQEKFGNTVVMLEHGRADEAESKMLYDHVGKLDNELGAIWAEHNVISKTNQKLLTRMNRVKSWLTRQVYSKENLDVLKTLAGTKNEYIARSLLEKELKKRYELLVCELALNKEACFLRLVAIESQHRLLKMERDEIVSKAWNLKVRANQEYISAGCTPIIREARPAYSKPGQPQKERVNGKK